MSGIQPAIHEQKTEQKSSDIGNFLAKRGIILVKEFRNMSALKGDYGDKIEVATVILSSGKSRQGTVQYGVKVEHLNEEGDVRGSGFLDFDELPELIAAFDFIEEVAQQMGGQERDYTEVTYSTKDNLKFGFYQSNGEQMAFIDVGGYGESLFVSVSKLQGLKKSIEAAKSHLLNRGAHDDNDQ